MQRDANSLAADEVLDTVAVGARKRAYNE